MSWDWEKLKRQQQSKKGINLMHKDKSISLEFVKLILDVLITWVWPAVWRIAVYVVVWLCAGIFLRFGWLIADTIIRIF